MHKLRLLVPLLLTLSFHAHGAEFLHYEKNVHPSVGVLRFELVGVPEESAEGSCCGGEDVEATLVISSSLGKEIQRIPQESFPVRCGRLDFLDVNGDGYLDLLIYNAPESIGPLTHADVWMYAPQRGSFVLSQTLSGRGEVKKSRQPNCVLVEYKKDWIDYATEEWCFNQDRGRWRMVKSR